MLCYFILQCAGLFQRRHQNCSRKTSKFAIRDRGAHKCSFDKNAPNKLNLAHILSVIDKNNELAQGC